MISVEALRDEREESYKVWFERWWKRADIESRIINANYRGFTYLNINMYDSDAYTRNRLRDNLFIACLEKKLPGFKISNEYNQGVFNIQKSEIRISWDIEDE